MSINSAVNHSHGSRGRKQEHQSSSSKDADVFLVISIGTPMDVPAHFPVTSDM